MAGGSQETAASADGSAGKRPAQDGHPSSSSLRTGTAAAALHPSEPGLLLPSPPGTPPRQPRLRPCGWARCLLCSSTAVRCQQLTGDFGIQPRMLNTSKVFSRTEVS